jgi:hypothetical protein
MGGFGFRVIRCLEDTPDVRPSLGELLRMP